MQRELGTLEKSVGERIADIWHPTNYASDRAGEDGGETSDSWKARMEAVEKAARRNPIENVLKPELKAGEWKLKVMDL